MVPKGAGGWDFNTLVWGIYSNPQQSCLCISSVTNENIRKGNGATGSLYEINKRDIWSKMAGIKHGEEIKRVCKSKTMSNTAREPSVDERFQKVSEKLRMKTDN